MNWGKQRNCSE